MILQHWQENNLHPSHSMMSTGSERLNTEVNIRSGLEDHKKNLHFRSSLPKRKPEKNKIMRLSKNDEPPALRCKLCYYEATSLLDLNIHNLSCLRKSPTTFNRSPTPEENNSTSFQEDKQPVNGFHQIMKLLKQPSSENEGQQTALETIIKAQMSLSRFSQNQENKDSVEAKENNPYSFISQQLLQFQLMQLVQAQISMNSAKSSFDSQSDTEEMDSSLTPERSTTPERAEPEDEPVFRDSLLDEVTNVEENGSPKPQNSFSSMIIQHTESPPPKGLNSLEMLQRTADEVLTNASKGLLTNRLIDSVGENDSKDSDIRHRCRYCGKIFSSDSALQIHIRSHTGERPFKCNICGNRFTTRGNLKVHFSRHTDRFPHIKMNHNPIPESLDKYYPPLLKNAEDENMLPMDSSPPFPISNTTNHTLRPNIPISIAQELAIKDLKDRIAQSFGLERSILDFNHINGNSMQDLLAKIEAIKASRILHKDLPSDEEMYSNEKIDSPISPHSEIKEEIDSNDEMDSLEKRSIIEENREDYNKSVPKFELPNHSIDSLLSNNDNLKKERTFIKENNKSCSIERQNELKPELKSPVMREFNERPVYDHSPAYENKESFESDRQMEDKIAESSYNDYSAEAEPNKKLSENESSPIEFSHFPFLGMPMPPKLSMLHSMTMQSPPLSNGMVGPPCMDPAKYPTVYSSLLPKPGCNDSTWESLIEVDQSNEKEKVEALMVKSRQKPTEPNQCGICFRVLSCKSALHMHYRVHTGQRPFKCRICSRAFTTKGNLKTHMSVHRSKPPMRMFHQCTVCHKKFSNALILQQHIRLHTGEPTDLSLEQIAAGEIREMPMEMSIALGFSPFHPVNGLHSPAPPRVPFSPLLLPFPFNAHQRPLEKDLLCTKTNSSAGGSPRSVSGSSAEHLVAEDLSVKGKEDLNFESARSTVSPMSSDFSDIDEKSPVTDHRTYNSKSIIDPQNIISPLPPNNSVQSLFPAIFSSSGVLSSLKSNLSNTTPFSNSMAHQTGNTTCKICFKVFACQSALEIHYRSHTKERPFKCPGCEKSFSTKGNMRQHLATHKPHEIGSEDLHDNYSSRGYDDVPALSDYSAEYRMDLGGKRLNEDEIIPPEAKRSTGMTAYNRLRYIACLALGIKPMYSSW